MAPIKMNNLDLSPDNDKSFVRYTYSDIREEQKFLQRTMFSVLGLLALALGYILKESEPSYLLASQLLWLAAMLEFLLFSDYIFKTKFLIELELLFDPSQNDKNPRPPLLQYWTHRYQYTKLCAYSIAVAALAFWTVVTFLWLWYKIVTKENHLYPINWILLPAETIIGIIALIKLCFEIFKADKTS